MPGSLRRQNNQDGRAKTVLAPTAQARRSRALHLASRRTGATHPPLALTLVLLLEGKRKGATEVRDIYGTCIRLTRDGLTYGEEFVPFDKMGNMQPAPHTFWNPGTNLFEVTVVRRNGPDLVIKNLPLQTADRLREAIIDALRERYT